jgi:hypothetical protein
MSTLNVNVNLADEVLTVAVWTIAAQEGTGGARVAALAEAAGVSLLDRKTLALFAHQLDPDFPELDELEGRLGGRLNTLASQHGDHCRFSRRPP